MKIRFQLNVLVNKKDDNQADGYVTNGNHSFVAYVLREIDNARNRGSFSTAANYNTAIKSLLKYLTPVRDKNSS